MVRLELDDIDRRLLRLLAEDGRMSNRALADAVDVAPSTALLRIRRMLDAGVITGFRADLAPAAVGLPLQAIVAVRIRSEHRSRIGSLTALFAGLPGVLNVYFLSGTDDFHVHVAVATSEGLRDFVVKHLSPLPEVANTHTSLIFEHVARTVL